MDFTTFCEDVLGHPLSDWQKAYLNNMYDLFKTAKEENRTINIIKSGRGSCKTSHITAIYLASEYEKYLKEKDDIVIGHRMSDTESLNAVMDSGKMIRSNTIDEPLA